MYLLIINQAARIIYWRFLHPISGRVGYDGTASLPCFKIKNIKLFSQLTCPTYKVLKQLPQKLFGILVNQLSACVKFILSECDYNLWCVDWVHIQKNKNLAKVILSPGATQHANRGAHYGNRLFVEGVIPIWS
jgi:hypothetical protein